MLNLVLRCLRLGIAHNVWSYDEVIQLKKIIRNMERFNRE